MKIGNSIIKKSAYLLYFFMVMSTGNFQAFSMKVPPEEVINLMASRPHRLHHFVWHQVRNNWEWYPAETRKKISDLGWTPGGDENNPRPAYYKGDTEDKRIFALDNNSGEDFLYMHRQMIAQVNEVLKNVGDPNYPKVEGWKSLPAPEDTDFPVPPAWGSSSRLKTIKSPEFYHETMKVWESYYLLPENLQRLTLGQLGSLIELTIHNQMHNRWSAEPTIERPQPEEESNPEGIPSGPWDAPSYNYLGDTYSSHVNPTFWYIHGWVDSCIDRWQEANGLTSINWKGTWVGKMPQGVTHRNFIRAMAMTPAHGEHEHGHDHHLHNLIEVVKLIGKCGIVSEFYTEWRD